MLVNLPDIPMNERFRGLRTLKCAHAQLEKMLALAGKAVEAIPEMMSIIKPSTVEGAECVILEGSELPGSIHVRTGTPVAFDEFIEDITTDAAASGLTPNKFEDFPLTFQKAIMADQVYLAIN